MIKIHLKQMNIQLKLLKKNKYKKRKWKDNNNAGELEHNYHKINLKKIL